MTNRLRFKLTALLVTLVVAGPVVTLFVVGRVTQFHFRDYVAESDAMRAAHLAETLSVYYEREGGFAGAEELIGRALHPPAPDDHRMMMHEMRRSMAPRMMTPLEPERLLLIEPDGKIAIDTTGASRPEDVIDRGLNEGVPVIHGGGEVGRVLVGSMIDSSFDPRQERFLASVRMGVLVSAVVVAALGLLLGSLILAGLTRPLRELTAAAEAVAAGDLNAPVTAGSHDEVATLAQAFSSMRDALAEAERQRQRMFRDIAHELRTPVAVLRGEIEAMVDGVYEVNKANLQSLQQEIEVLDRLVSDVRTISSMDGADFGVVRAPTEIPALLETVRISFQKQAAERGIRIEVQTDPELPTVPGDEERLMQVFGNLVLNAVRHSQTADRIILQARRTYPPADGVEITVTDNGRGIPEAEREAVFERLYRVDPARSRSTGGAGLGLSLARRIVEAHAGTITAADVDGGGARITVFLPLPSRP